jgi:hypothetical protein
VAGVTPSLNAVAAAFDLGAPVDRPAALPGGGPARRWRLRTGRGTWMVKTCAVPAAWELEQMRDAGTLELAAYGAGVAMPRPVEPPGPAVGLWRALDGGYARVSAWVEGISPPDVTVSLAGWLGRTMAAIDRLDLPVDPAAGVAYVLHPMADWDRWLDGVRAAGLIDRRAAAGARAAVVEATALVTAGLAAGPAFRLGHRDIHTRNFLATDHGVVLIDFDSAGPEVPWWGAVAHAWDLARPDVAMLAPAALAAYVEHGGRPGPAEVTAFAGLLRLMLDGFSFQLRMATGLLPGTPRRRAAARRSTPLFVRGVPEVLSWLDDWVKLLR